MMRCIPVVCSCNDSRLLLLLLLPLLKVQMWPVSAVHSAHHHHYHHLCMRYKALINELADGERKMQCAHCCCCC